MKIEDQPVRPPPSTSTMSCNGRGWRGAAGDRGVLEEQRSSFMDCPACVPRAVFPVEGQNDELQASDEQEGADVPPSLPNPYQPTRSEYLDHCTTHFPYRAWCRHCVEGRGREFGHSQQAGWKDARAAAVISFDYCVLADDSEVATEEEFVAAGNKAVKVLVVRDSQSKSLFAHVVPQKGIDDRGVAVQCLVLVDDARWLGYSEITLKSDNEPAIVKLLSEALRELRINGVAQVLEDHPLEYGPLANGSAEVGVRLFVVVS